MGKNLPAKEGYQKLISSIGGLLKQARQKAFRVVNNILVRTYWEIGRLIVEYESNAGEKAEYGNKLFERIAADLKRSYGKGFSRSNVIYMRLLYLKYQKSQTLSDQLSWSHDVELLGVSDELARAFYEKVGWNYRTRKDCKRRLNTLLLAKNGRAG